MRRGWILAAGFAAGTLSASPDFADVVNPFIAAHCADCHGEKKQKADLRLDTLGTDLTQPDIPAVWRDVIDQLRAGEMPPAERDRPPAEDLARVIATIDARLREAAKAAIAHRGPVTRRLSRSALNHTVGDLLGFEVRLAQELPPDPFVHGFDNLAATAVATTEWLAAWQLEVRRVIELALGEGPDPRVDLHFAPAAVIARYPQPDPRLKSISGHNFRSVAWPENFAAERPGTYDFEVTGFWRENRELLATANATVEPKPDENPQSLQFRRERQVRALKPPESPATTRVVAFYAGPLENTADGKLAIARDLRLLGYAPVTPEPGPVRVSGRLERGEGLAIKFLWGDGREPEFVEREAGDREIKIGEGLYVDGLRVSGPRLPGWPTPLQRELLAQPDDVRAGLESFLRRAFRRPPPGDVTARYVALYGTRRAAGDTPVQAMRTVVELALCSPLFLYTHFDAAQPDDFALAARLSYFLWNSAPDADLLAAAETGKLASAAGVKAQVERLLADPRSLRFSRDFTDHWLWLNKLPDVTPDRGFGYEPMLERAVAEETVAFFSHVLRENLPVGTLVNADFVLVNERLARHYGIKGVHGSELRRVPVARTFPRGGLLGQASILTLTSDGSRTSPVKRGVWILENILGRPPAPPPPIEPIEPDIRGATTIREILAKHRDVETCNECHQRIDPMGFALEAFNPVGALRSSYGGRKVMDPVSGEIILQPKLPIDDAVQLPNGTAFKALPGLKDVLFAQRERLARTLVDKLFLQAIGTEPSFAQATELDRLVQEAAVHDFRLRDLLVAFATSGLVTGRPPAAASSLVQASP